MKITSHTARNNKLRNDIKYFQTLTRGNNDSASMGVNATVKSNPFGEFKAMVDEMTDMMSWMSSMITSQMRITADMMAGLTDLGVASKSLLSSTTTMSSDVTALGSEVHAMDSLMVNLNDCKS